MKRAGILRSRPLEELDLVREGRTRTRRGPDVLVNPIRQCRVAVASATDRRTDVDEVRIRTIRVSAGVLRVAVDHGAGFAVQPDRQLGEARPPGESPEVPTRAVEVELFPGAV